MLTIDKDKYIQILKIQGHSAAITSLHRDMEQWELETFEGPKGWQPQMYKDLEEVRTFSRELWELALQHGGAKSIQG